MEAHVNASGDADSGREWSIRPPERLGAELQVMAADGKLRGIRRTRLDLVQDWLDQGLDAEETCRRLTAFNEDVVLAVLEAHADRYAWLKDCTFLEFGSGGRGEQVMGSDQDNGLLVRGNPDPDELDEATGDIVLALDGAGLPLCRGGIMVSSEEWRGDFDCWLERLTGWLSNPMEKGPWQSGLILDFRSLYGSRAEALLLRDRLWEFVRSRPVAVRMLVDELTQYRLPLTFYGAFITEKSGPWHGFLDIKHSVLAHLTNGARILALKYGLPELHTCDRIRALAAQGHVSERHGTDMLTAWEHLQRMRLEIGLACAEEGLSGHSYVNPSYMCKADKKRLRDAVAAAEKLIRLVQAGAGL